MKRIKQDNRSLPLEEEKSSSIGTGVPTPKLDSKTRVKKTRGKRVGQNKTKSNLSRETELALSSSISSQQGEIDALSEVNDELREIIIHHDVAVPEVKMIHVKPLVDNKKENSLNCARQLIRQKAITLSGHSKQESMVLSYLPVVAGVSKIADHHSLYFDVLRNIAREEIIDSKPLLSGYDKWKKWLKGVRRDFVWNNRSTLLVSCVLVLLMIVVGMVYLATYEHWFWMCYSFCWSLLVIFVIWCIFKTHPESYKDMPYLVDHCCRNDFVSPIISGSFSRTSRPVCVSRTYCIGFTINANRLYIPRSCSHNEEVALKTRQMTPALSDAPTRSQEWKLALKEFSRRELNRFSCFEHVSYEDELRFISKMTSSQKAVYAVAKRNSVNEVVINADTRMFVKIEAGYTKKIPSKTNPRCISGKSPDYFFNTGPAYWLWSETLKKKYWSDISDCLNMQYIYSGGLDAIAIGYIIHHYECMGWYAMEGDFSRYDGHNEVEALDAEFTFYEDCGMPKDLLHFFRLQMNTKGTSMSGHKFKVDGKVASGVANTSVGNTIRNFMIATRVSVVCGQHIVVMANGDDFIYFSPVPFKPNLVVTVCLSMGHKLECIERPDYDYIEYCSMRAWNIGGTRVMGPKPFRALGKTFISTKTNIDKTKIFDHIRGIAVGMRGFSWVPVLGRVVDKLAFGFEGKSVDYTNNPYAIRCDLNMEIDMDSVLHQFEKIYGIPLQHFEMELDGLDFNRVGWSYQSDTMDIGLAIDGCLT